MKKIIYILLISIAAISCSNSLPPEYQVDEPRIISVKIEDPEVSMDPTAEGEIKLSVLVAGKGVDQNMEQNVYWMVNPIQRQLQSDLSSPYNDFLTITTEEILGIANSFAPSQTTGVTDLPDYFDYPITGVITIQERNLYFNHTIRFAKTPKHFNPGIIQIELSSSEPKEDGNKYRKIVEKAVVEKSEDDKAKSDLIQFKDDVPDFFIAKVITKDLEQTGNARHVYSWYISKAHEKDNDNEVLITSDEKFKFASPDENGVYQNSTLNVSEFKQTAVFELKKDGKEQSGTYDVYIVVRDLNRDAKSVADDHFGQDYHHFQICVKDGCK